MRFKYILALAAFLSAGPGATQSLSVEDIQKQIDAELNKGSEYIELLNQADTKRALAAMKVMMNSGDPELAKLAADFGLYSSNTAVRLEALKGFLATNPRIDLFFAEKGSKGEFGSAMKQIFSIEPNSEGVAATNRMVGEYDPKDDCYMRGSNKCWLQVRPEAILVNFYGTWNQLSFTDDASLVGNVNLGYATEVPVRLQLR